MSVNPLLVKAQACADSIELLRQMVQILQFAINSRLSSSVSLSAAQITALQADYATLKTQLQTAIVNV